MSADRVEVYFTFDATLDSRFFEGLLIECLQFGCKTTQSSDGETLSLDVSSRPINRGDVTIETAANALAQADHASVDLRYEDLRVALSKNEVAETQPECPHFSILVWNSQFNGTTSESKTEIHERVQQFVSLVGSIFEATDSILAYGKLGRIEKEHHPTINDLSDRNPDLLTWINAYSADIVAEFDENTLERLPWSNYRTLDNGAVVTLTTSTPIEFGELNDASTTISEALSLPIV